MTLAELQTFLAIVETGSLARAAARLNVTQSTVTARLQALEADLGQTLILRRKTGAQLTAAGAKFRRYAAAMSGLWRQARAETALPTGVSAVCNIGCAADLWPILGRRVVARIRALHPETALTVEPCAEAELEDRLGAGLIDMALAWRPSAREGATSRRLWEERLILVSTRPDAPPRGDPGYVFVDQGEAFGRRHHAAYADAGTARLGFGSAVWARDHLLATGGSAYLPESLAAPELARGTLYEVAGAPAFARPVFLTTDDAAAEGWPWLDRLAAELSAGPVTP